MHYTLNTPQYIILHSQSSLDSHNSGPCHMLQVNSESTEANFPSRLRRGRAKIQNCIQNPKKKRKQNSK